MALRRQKLTLDARITEPLIGPLEISQGDGECGETSTSLPVKSPLMLWDERSPAGRGARAGSADVAGCVSRLIYTIDVSVNQC